MLLLCMQSFQGAVARLAVAGYPALAYGRLAGAWRKPKPKRMQRPMCSLGLYCFNVLTWPCVVACIVVFFIDSYYACHNLAYSGAEMQSTLLGGLQSAAPLGRVSHGVTLVNECITVKHLLLYGKGPRCLTTQLFVFVCSIFADEMLSPRIPACSPRHPSH